MGSIFLGWGLLHSFSHGGFTSRQLDDGNLWVCVDCFGLPKCTLAHFSADCVANKKKKKLISLGEGNLDTIHISLPDKQKRVVVVGGGRVCITCNKSVRLDVLLALALAVVP